MTHQSDEPAPERSDDHAAERLEEFVRERFPDGLPPEERPREGAEDQAEEDVPASEGPSTFEKPGSGGTEMEGAPSS